MPIISVGVMFPYTLPNTALTLTRWGGVGGARCGLSHTLRW